MPTAWTCNLDKDIKDLPNLKTFNAKNVDLARRDGITGKVNSQIMQVESRLLPCGLHTHTVGTPPTAKEAIATRVNIAQLDCLKDCIESIPCIIATSIGQDINKVYHGNNQGLLVDVKLNKKITQASRRAVRALVNQSTDSNGHVKEVKNIFDQATSLFGGLFGAKKPWTQAIIDAGFPGVNEERLAPVFAYIEFCLKQVVANNELPNIMELLNRQFLMPAPGGDPIRNPEVLLTGRNMHTLDPSSIPTTAAVEAAKQGFCKLLEKLLMRTMAPTLKVLPSLCGKLITSKGMENPWPRSSLVDVCPVSDLLGHINKVELIPLKILGRPCIDVFVSCSGVIRDLFVNQMKRWPPRPMSLSTRTLSASMPLSRPWSSISWYARTLATSSPTPSDHSVPTSDSPSRMEVGTTINNSSSNSSSSRDPSLALTSRG